MKIAIALLLFMVSIANADPRTGSLSYDYRNTPNMSQLVGFDRVVLAARSVTTPSNADSIHAWGGKVLALVQPTLAAWMRKPADNPSEYPWDAMLWKAARQYDGLLRTANGDTAWMFPGENYAAAVWDLSNPIFVDEVGRTIISSLNYGDGIVLDYGCGDLSGWTPGVDPKVWAAWREGWINLIGYVRKSAPSWVIVCQCDQFGLTATPSICDGLLLERAGQSLNYPAKAWRNVIADSTSRFLFRQEDLDPQRRRLFASMALLTDGYYNQCGDPNKTPPVNYHDIEHWNLNLGIAGSHFWEKIPNVYQRVWSRGIVIMNLSANSYQYAYSKKNIYTIYPNDALVLQNRDAYGRFISPITDSGR